MNTRREIAILRLVIGVLIVLALALAITVGVLSNNNGDKPAPSNDQHKGNNDEDADEHESCARTHHTPRDLDNPDIFDDLSREEMVAVRDYTIFQLDLEQFEKVMQNRDLTRPYIFAIDLFLPEKRAALEYLDSNGPMPERNALVVVIRGDTNPPSIEEYVVGPVSNPSYCRLYRNPSYRRYPIPRHTKFDDAAEFASLYDILQKTSETVHTVLKQSFGAGAHNCTSDETCLLPVEFAPRLNTTNQRTTLFVYFIHTEGYYLRPTCFMVTIDHISVITTDWKVANVYYNGQTFSSPEELVRQYNMDSIDKVSVPLSSYRDYYSYRKRGTHNMPDTPQMGPRLYEPEGKRYTVTGRKVEYMGWSFNFRSRFSSGLQLFDVKFRNERIVYELGLQEAVVIYAGYDLLSTIATYYDMGWNMGETSFELMPGVDCPETATFFDMDYFVNSYKPKRNRKSVCIFELNTGTPLRRHYTPDYVGGFEYYAGVQDYQLVVRQISTIWNYDYVIDYIFRLNGAIEVRAAATGYPQSVWYTPKENDYGHKIYNNIFGNMHIHNFHFKVDVDVVGTQNRFETLDIGVETVDNPWFGGKKTQMRLDRTLKNTEKEALYHYNFDNPKQCLFYNENQTNSYGTKRGFLLKPVGIAKFVLPDNVTSANGASWTKYQVAVTKHNDSEQMSSSIYNQNDPFDPVLDFDDFVNDDQSIVDEDLVAWVSLATHHVPHSEDAPSTQTPYNTLNFFLYPYNYHDQDPSVSSSDTVWVKPDGKTNKIDRFGTSTKPKCKPSAVDTIEFNGTSYVDGYN